MFCKYCGSELPDGTTFCINCGKDDTFEKDNIKAQERGESSSFEYIPSAPKEDIQKDPQRSSMASRILTYAIMGLAFATTYYLSVIGLIFSIISRSKLKKYLKIYKDTEGKATVGKHIGLAALISSIVITSLLCLNITEYLFEAFMPFILEQFGY